MQISGAAWGRGVEDADQKAYSDLVTTGDEKKDPLTELMVKQYKASTADFALEQLVALREVLGRGKPTYIPASDLAKLDREIENRNDPGWIAEQARKAEERRAKQTATEDRLLRQGRAKLGGDGDTWSARAGRIKAWWKAVKAAEKEETWSSAFGANRMSARQIGSTQTMGGEFTVRNKHARTDARRDRTIFLDRGATGIGERMKPGNFHDPETGASQKNEKGLHDLSASLLDGTKTPSSILAQLKPYKNSIVVFMPVPAEEDLQIFHAIANLEAPDAKALGDMRSKLTRVKYAQGSDMHTTLFDVSASPDEPAQIRYGVTGRAHRKGEEETMADETDLAARRTNALEHSVILKDGAVQKVNEIVMAYRSHDSARFPLFARWNADKKQFDVIDPDHEWAGTGAYITDAGVWHD
ncbi:hypothetical protein [Amycolatopsis sp. PS_44_ISF1]|uniref:hypothetical protein n=1 Tax=Amycolatopsis sp. PS_44_ISF1 TaxID=2974917 RepID=UPI0028DD6613|nr:hypothetical protein [Amycolatopsis sp. PS_44_ISF1]MDT8914949.1 hypothetical protein [Amycolatopsis sp. PS_44_ISF1]